MVTQVPGNASSLSEVLRQVKLEWAQAGVPSTFDRAVWSEPLARWVGRYVFSMLFLCCRTTGEAQVSEIGEG